MKGPVERFGVRSHHTFNFGVPHSCSITFCAFFTSPNSAVVPVHLIRDLEGYLLREDDMFHLTSITFST
jgi:hypothetical protein